MKAIIEIEITHPVVANEETDAIPEGVKVHLEITEGLWEGAWWSGKIIRTLPRLAELERKVAQLEKKSPPHFTSG